MSIKLVESELQILRCFPIMSQLRPHVEQTNFVEQVRYQMKQGY
jgi:hypothetical protein